MKICLIGPIPPPAGGMAMQTLQLQKLLTEKGHQVTLLPVNTPYRPAMVGKIPVLRAGCRLVHYLYLLYTQLRGHEVVHLMANSGWSFHLYARPAVWMARKFKIPVIINYRGGSAKTFFASAWGRIRHTFDAAARVVVPSGYLHAVFADYGVRASIVPNIVDLSLFAFTPPTLPKDGLHLVVTRNLEALYDNETAIRAFALIAQQCPTARLTIAGDGPQRQHLSALCQTLGIGHRVTFAGRLDRAQMAALYASAHIMLNPSRVDNMPNSILEALACGVLVVSTDVGGIPYMVTDQEQALLVPSGSPQDMAKAVFSLLEDADLASRLAHNGKDLVQSYQPQSVLPQLESIYRDVTA